MPALCMMQTKRALTYAGKPFLSGKSWKTTHDPWRYAHFGADSFSLLTESTCKTCLGNRRNSLIPKHVLQVHSLPSISSANSETYIEVLVELLLASTI